MLCKCQHAAVRDHLFYTRSQTCELLCERPSDNRHVMKGGRGSADRTPANPLPKALRPICHDLSQAGTHLAVSEDALPFDAAGRAVSMLSTLSSSSEAIALMHLESMKACLMMSFCREHKSVSDRGYYVSALNFVLLLRGDAADTTGVNAGLLHDVTLRRAHLSYSQRDPIPGDTAVGLILPYSVLQPPLSSLQSWSLRSGPLV